MHSIPQITRAQSRSQTDGDGVDVDPVVYFPERGKNKTKFDLF